MGDNKHAGHSVAMFRDRFWVSLLLTLPALAWGHMLQQALGYTAPQFPGATWIAPVFGTAVFLYGGWVFIQGAVRELKDRLPGMMVLITLAILVAFVFSAVVTLGYPGMPLWEELATLITIMLLGHWIEMRSISQAQGALKELAKLLPSTATRVDGERTEEVPIAELRDGDVVLVRPGERVPADGVVRQGASAVNESMITGESRPVDKKEGDTAIAGTVNGAGSLRREGDGNGRGYRARRHRAPRGAGAELAFPGAGIGRPRGVHSHARRAGRGRGDFVAWLVLRPNDPAFAMERVVTVLVIACPHALGLAIPLVIAISTSVGARSGLLVRDRRGLEEARRVTAVVFDKTGTLTRGEFGVVDIAVSDELGAEEALRLAAAVEGDSEHTIARGIVRTARERGIAAHGATDFAAIPGKGVRARVDGRELSMGGPALVKGLSLEVPATLREAAERAAQRGQASIYLADRRRVLAAFAVADVVRPESREAVRALHERHMQVVMMTGDAQPVAQAVASELGIDTVFAEVLPERRRTGSRTSSAPGNVWRWWAMA